MTQPAVYLIGAGPGDPGPDHRARPRVPARGRRRHPRPPRVSRGCCSRRAPDAELIDVGTRRAAADGAGSHQLPARREGARGQAASRGSSGATRSCSIAAAKKRCSCTSRASRSRWCPGMPAGIAVPAYAGVPVTYPGGGDTITLVRGYEDESRTPPDIDWASLAALEGTVVCYAGAQQLPLHPRGAARRTAGPATTHAVDRLQRHAAEPGDASPGRSTSCSSALREHAAARAGDPRSSAASSASASTCAGSTRGRCSARACW